MSEKKFRVGIIGADTQASWAGASHVPALNSQPAMVLAAVATRREQSAKAAAEAFGVERWYADPYELIRDETIDVVTIAVKVSAHRDLVLAALKAGKAVYSESPLGATLMETEEMAAAAGSLHTAIGLQGRHNPALRRAAELVASGKIGRVMSARVNATTFGYGPQATSAYDYFNKAASGASFMTITTGHVLDVIEATLGNITEIDARTALLWREIWRGAPTRPRALIMRSIIAGWWPPSSAPRRQASGNATCRNRAIVDLPGFRHCTLVGTSRVSFPYVKRWNLERRASLWTHKVRSNSLNLRIVLSENRFRFSGRCCNFGRLVVSRP